MNNPPKDTHPAQLDNPLLGLPSSFMLGSNVEYNETHYVFTDLANNQYLVPKGEVHRVCPRPEGVPMQPANGYIARFEDGAEFWVRLADGLWYRIDPVEASTEYKNVKGIYWEELWDRHGSAHWTAMAPLDPDKFTLGISIEGPTYELTRPDMSSGEPQPGLIAKIDEENGNLTITDSKTNQTMVWDTDTAVTVMNFYWRTLMDVRMKMQEEHAGHRHMPTPGQFLKSILSRAFGQEVDIVPVNLDDDNEDDKE